MVQDKISHLCLHELFLSRYSFINPVADAPVDTFYLLDEVVGNIHIAKDAIIHAL